MRAEDQAAGTPQSQMAGIHRADRGFRLRMLALLASCLLIALLAAWLLPGWLDALRSDNLDRDPLELQQMLRIAFTAVAVLMIAPMLLMARLALAWAERIRSADRFPTADMKTIRDVVVRSGVPAQRIAGRHRAAGVTLVWFCVGLMAWVAWIWLG